VIYKHLSSTSNLDSADQIEVTVF